MSRQTGELDPTINLDEVAQLVVRQFEAAPCAVVAAAVHNGSDYVVGQGVCGSVGPGQAATPDTVFDLASLTKPATALLAARLQKQGCIKREWPLRRVLPELGRAGLAAEMVDVSLDLLMAHRSGLEAHIEFFEKIADAKQPMVTEILRRAAGARRRDCVGPVPSAGFQPVYSDLGYILAGQGLARCAGDDLDALVAREVAQPLALALGSVRQWKGWDVDFEQRVAATEEVAWRGGVLRGIVHDENAWVLAGEGSAGHAGLFGTAPAVLSLGMAILDSLHGRQHDWLGQADLEPLLRRRPGGSHCAGFDRRTPEKPSSGAFFGSETFGHLGFTGTSLWIDPERELVAVLLSNRVHPTREHIAIRQARPAAHDLLYAQMMRALGQEGS